MVSRVADQPDLFKPGESPERGSLVDQLDEHPGEEFIRTVRRDLMNILALVRESPELPWCDLTRAYAVEMQFLSMSRWLPVNEAASLRHSFSLEMERLYGVAGELRPEIPEMDY